METTQEVIDALYYTVRRLSEIESGSMTTKDGIKLTKEDILYEIRTNYENDIDFLFQIISHGSSTWNNLRAVIGKGLEVLTLDGELGNINISECWHENSYGHKSLIGANGEIIEKYACNKCGFKVPDKYIDNL
jgi:hypothetical protein